jgi:ornithine carbamoyltransferase
MLDYSRAEIEALLDRTEVLRARWRAGDLPQLLRGKRVALIWDAGGFRNRVAFELGIQALGGAAVQVPGELGAREPIEDVARYLANWVDAVVARTRRHEHMLRLASGPVPVINARTDYNHPCEILGDLAWLRARRGTLEGLRVAFVGEATNLCHPWLEAAARLPIGVVQVCPPGYEVKADLLGMLRSGAAGVLETSSDLESALSDADVVYTDCWPARRSARERSEVAAVFLPYQITPERLERAPRGVAFLPCPPVTRGEEVSADAMERFGQDVYEAKEYLLHAQNAVLATLLGR